MGRPSVTYQVTEMLKKVFTPGVSRHELKSRGLDSERITGIQTMQDYVKSCSLFARWCKENHGVRDIRRITPAMAEQYVSGLHDRELSGGYIGKVKSALCKLDAVMKARGYHPHNAPPLLSPGGGWHSDRRPERAYTPDQAERIIDHLRGHARDKQTASVVQLQWVAGLRVSEAAMIRGQDINPRTCTVHAVRATKGGRARVVSIDPKHRPFLEKLDERASAHRDGHVFQGRGSRGASLIRRTQEAVSYACGRLEITGYGTHGFRRGWAQERYGTLRDQGLDDHAARWSVARGLGHNRLDVTYSYIPRGDTGDVDHGIGLGGSCHHDGGA